MATSPNFSWPEPDNTDLVKNGALAIRTAINAIDTSMVDLKGGTTGQVLSKASATDMDFSWVTDATGIPATIFDAKGDIIAATAADTAGRLAVGTNGQTLVADSSTATGLKWATPSSGALVHIKTATFTSVADTSTTFDGVFTSTYNTYQIVFSAFGATPASAFQFQFRYAGPTTQAANYLWQNDIIEGAGPSSTLTRNASDTLVQIQKYMDNSGYGINGEINVYLDDVSGASRPSLTFNSFAEAYGAWVSGAAYVDAARTYTGFILKSASGNITGTVSVYGLVKA